MNNPLECATNFAGRAADTEPTPAQTEFFDLMELLTKGFPKHGRTASDAPSDYSKSPAQAEPQTLICSNPYVSPSQNGPIRMLPRR